MNASPLPPPAPTLRARLRRHVAAVLATLALLLLGMLWWQKADVLSRIVALTPELSAHAEIEVSLHGLNGQILALQTSRRHFVLKGEERALKDFEQAAYDSQRSLSELRAATGPDGRLQDAALAQSVQRIDAMVLAYITQLRQSIRLRIQAPDDQAAQAQATDESLSMSRSLLAELGAIGGVLRAHLKGDVDQLIAATEQAQKRERWWSGLAALAVALGFGVAGLQMRQRALAQAALERSNLALEGRVAARTAALGESEHRYRTLVELSADAVLLINRAFVVEYANAAGRTLLQRLGYPVPVGQPAELLLGSLFGQAMRQVLSPLWEQPGALPYTAATLRGAQGAAVPVQWSAASHAASDGAAAVASVQVVIHDLTDLRRSEAAAQERALFIDQLIEAIPAPVSVRDGQGRFLQINAAFERTYKTARSAVLRQTPFDLLGEQAAWEVLRQDAQAARAASPMQYELHVASRHVLAQACAIVGADGQLQGVVTVEADITALREKEAELSKANSTLLRLSADLRQTQERERRHIARELHDQVGQIMTALKLSIGQLATEAGVPRPMLHKRLAIVDEALRHTRSLSHTLHPHVLEDLGLAAGLESLAEQFAGPGSPRIHLALNLEPARSHPDHELTAYRVVQEALTNVLRHAGAATVHIEAACEGGLLTLSVRDDGRGFVVQGATTSSLGLVGMRERLYGLGGELHIDSAPAAGTELRAWLPWPAVADAAMVEARAEQAQGVSG